MNEQIAVLGETIETERSTVPISTSIAFGRLKQISTFRYMLIGIGALGFGLFSVPIFLNVFLEDHFGLSALRARGGRLDRRRPVADRAAVRGRLNDRLFRASPPQSLVLCAGLISLFGVFVTVALFMPNVASFVTFLALATMCANGGFMLIGPIVSAVVPYRLRTQGFAMVGVYVFLSGAFLGAVLAGLMSDAWGVRTGLSLLCIPSALIGGALLASGAAHIRGDIGLVMEELEEERAEADRVREPDADDHVLQVRNLDFSYGTGAGALRRRPRRAPRRGARAARHQRRRQVHAAALHLRPGHPEPRRGAAARARRSPTPSRSPGWGWAS